MKLLQRLTPLKRLGKTVRVRRFGCTVCDFQETIYGDGSGDKKTIPAQGIKEADDLFKQEEENRDI
jgi:hypothetical protein